MVTDPLKGFVLFENTSEIIQLSIGRGYIRISADAIRMIGDPNAINVFFDEPGKRIAVKAADSKMPNTFIMRKNTGLNKCAVLLEKIREILSFAKKRGVIGLGRWGEHEHYNSDRTVERAMELFAGLENK